MTKHCAPPPSGSPDSGQASAGSAPSPLEGRGLAGVLQFGLTVWAQEMAWIGKRLFRSLEIRQLEKRLDRERALLGKLVSTPGTDPGEIDLSKRQAAFLQTEIERLDQEFEERRRFFLRERRVRLGLGKD